MALSQENILKEMEKTTHLMKRVKKKCSGFRKKKKKEQKQNKTNYLKFPQDMNPLNMETGCVDSFPSMEGAGLELKASGTYWHRG